MQGIRNFVRFLCALNLSIVLAFKWHLNEALPTQKYFTFSERYMFADREGPLFLDKGPSFIKVDMDVTVYSKFNRSTNIGMAIYGASEGHHDSVLDGLCEDHTYPNSWATNVAMATLPTSYKSTVHIDSPLTGLNGTYHIHTMRVDYQYIVHKETWYNVVFVLCPGYNYPSTEGATQSQSQSQSHAELESQDAFISPGAEALGMTHSRVLAAAFGATSSKDTAGALTRTVGSFTPASQHVERRLGLGNKDITSYMSGTIAFRNPYGYIPAEMFGLLPFQIARVVAYAFFAAFFVTHYCQHRETTLALHNGFLLVFLFAFIEAMLWFASYETLNITGVPYCCPFPPLVVASLVLQVVRQTLSRSILLMVCLGYGIVRPKLMSAEWGAVGVVSALYLVCAFISQAAVILFAEEAHGDYGAVSSKLLPYKVPEMFLDVIFLTWIYLAVGSTIRILTEFQQSVKLDMYKQLVYIIGVFIVLFTVITVVFMLDATVMSFLPWQLAWLEQVIWETLNFAVLAAVCVVCRPTANSQLLSYASQLPTEDPDMDDDDEVHGATGGGFKLSSPGPWSDRGRPYVYGEEGDEPGREGYYDVGANSRNGGGSSNNGRNAGADGTEGYDVEMSSVGGGTRNPITSVYNKVQAAISGDRGKRTSRGSSSGPGRGNSAGGTSHEFGRLPAAEDEEYGLEQDDE